MGKYILKTGYFATIWEEANVAILSYSLNFRTSTDTESFKKVGYIVKRMSFWMDGGSRRGGKPLGWWLYTKKSTGASLMAPSQRVPKLMREGNYVTGCPGKRSISPGAQSI